MNRLTELLAAVSGNQAPVVYEAARPGDILRSMLRHTEACRILEWAPATSLEEGLNRTYRALRA